MIELEQLAAGWRPLVDDFLSSTEGQALQAYLVERSAAGARIFPPRPLRALELTPLANVRVVIVGQDPYHGAAQAQGLAFSVPSGQRLPPSLRNIYTELAREFGSAPRSGNLEGWAQQGVLLLNMVLTVEEQRPGAHAGRGWEALTSAIVHAVALDARPKVFLLWGTQAQRIRSCVDRTPHCVLQANHPSPLSARRPPLPFVGCGHFAAANAFLITSGQPPIDWLAQHG